MRADTVIEIGLERDALIVEINELRNRHRLLRQALAAVRAGEAGSSDARNALIHDAELAPEWEFYESEPPAASASPRQQLSTEDQ